MGKMVVFTGNNFNGDAETVTKDDSDARLGPLDIFSWDDEIGSIRVLEGAVSVFKDRNFNEDGATLNVGSYTGEELKSLKLVNGDIVDLHHDISSWYFVA